jgi:hypothetical protein
MSAGLDPEKPPLPPPSCPGAERPPGKGMRWVQGLLWVVALALLLHYGYKIIIGLAQKGKEGVTETIHATGDEIAKVASRFSQGTITEAFTAALPLLARTPGGNLELASLEATETFSRSDQRTTAWGWINLGTTVTEIKVPVTYRYHLRLNEPWRLLASNSVCVVYAPPIRTTRPPAIHTDRLEKKSDEGWLRFNAKEQMEELERNITPTLNVIARDPRHIALVREECRKTVAEFVRTWLLRENQWSADRFHSIKVIFPEEKDMNPDQVAPVITLKKD